MRITKEEKAKIRETICREYGPVDESCKPFRSSNGYIFVYNDNDGLRHVFPPNSRRFLDDDEIFDMTPEQKATSTPLTCFECPAYEWCFLIDCTVDCYNSRYGKPRSADEVIKRKYGNSQKI